MHVRRKRVAKQASKQAAAAPSEAMFPLSFRFTFTFSHHHAKCRQKKSHIIHGLLIQYDNNVFEIQKQL